MLSPTRAIKDRFLRYATELRFPKLLVLAISLFAVDLFIPDLIPFADEILLGLFAALLAVLKKSRRDRRDARTQNLTENAVSPKV